MINTYTTQRYLSETPYSNCGNKKLEDFYSKIYYLSLGLFWFIGRNAPIDSLKGLGAANPSNIT